MGWSFRFDGNSEVFELVPKSSNIGKALRIDKIVSNEIIGNV
jgi:hypothetical protein